MKLIAPSWWERALSSRPWFVPVLLSAAGLFAVLAIGPWQDRKTPQAVLSELRGIDTDSASLQRDVLRARAGLLRNYDPLVASVVALRQDILNLRGLFARPEVANDSQLSYLLAKMEISVDRAETAVELFKTQNALLQNSLNSFTQSLSTLYENTENADMEDHIRPMRIGNRMLQFSLDPHPILGREIGEDLDTLEASDDKQRSALSALVGHGRMVLALLPQVTSTVNMIQSSDTINTAQALQREYLESYGLDNARDQWVRIFLGSVSVYFCFFIIMLVYRLRRQTDLLARRLSYETAIRDIAVCFAMDGATSLSLKSSTEAALDVVNRFFNGIHCEMMFVDVTTEEISERFGAGDIELRFEDALLREILALVQSQEDDQHAIFKTVYETSPGDLSHKAGMTRLVLGFKCSDKMATIALVDYRKIKPQVSSNETMLFEHVIRYVCQNIEHRQRQDEHEILERRLEHAERLQAVGTLAGGIAHEFNNILGAILGYAEMARNKLRRNSNTRQYIDEVISAGNRARLIIDQILALSRKRERTIRPMDLGEVVMDAAPLLRVALPSGVELNFNSDEKETVVEGSPLEVQQILMNLCKNAVEAMAGSGWIDVTVRRLFLPRQRILSYGTIPAGDYVLLSVSDNGRGIPEAVLPHIFEPFFTTRSRTGGTGLGLAAVHGHVSALAGYIDVVSKLGSGSRLDIYLPRSLRKAGNVQTFFDEGQMPMGKGEIVVVLEKDPVTLEMYEDKIAALGYEAIGFKEFNSLLAWIAQKNEADLFLLDHGSLEWPASRDLKAIFGYTPVILIGDRNEFLSFAADARASSVVLQKPVSSKSMAYAIKSKMTA